MEKRKSPRVTLPLRFLIKKTGNFFPAKGLFSFLSPDRAIEGFLIDISSGGALLEIKKESLGAGLRGKNRDIILVEASEPLTLEIRTHTDAPLTQAQFLPRRLKMFRDSLYLGGEWACKDKRFIPMAGCGERNALVMTW